MDEDRLEMVAVRLLDAVTAVAALVPIFTILVGVAHLLEALQ